MRNLGILTLALVALVLASGCVQDSVDTSRICTDPETGLTMDIDKAYQLVENDECSGFGFVKDTYTCNMNTGTWWIDLDADKPGCSPACVVYVKTGKVEINWRCTGLEEPSGTGSFEACVEAGNPVMESYPRQCNDGTRTYTEEACSSGEGFVLTISDGYTVAESSPCTENGTLKETYVCNEFTGTLWIDLEPTEPNPICNPACVVDLMNRTAEINWRCTGALIPEE